MGTSVASDLSQNYQLVISTASTQHREIVEWLLVT